MNGVQTCALPISSKASTLGLEIENRALKVKIVFERAAREKAEASWHEALDEVGRWKRHKRHARCKDCPVRAQLYAQIHKQRDAKLHERERAVTAEVHAKTLKLELSAADAHDGELDKALSGVCATGDTLHEWRLSAIALLKDQRKTLATKLAMVRDDNTMLEKRIALAERVKDALGSAKCNRCGHSPCDCEEYMK